MNGNPGHCLNCGANLTGAYCATCGQRAIVHNISVWELVRDLVEELFDFDSRLWRSVLPLLFRPGLMTRDYLAGRRARYVAPLRLYLMLSVAFFVLAAVTGHGINLVVDEADLRAIAEQDLDPEVAGRVETAIQRRVDREQGLEPDSTSCQQIEITGDFAAAHLRDRIIRACEKVAADSGASLEAAAVDNIPIMMVVLIPVLALMMKLLYPLSRRYYVEHLLFVVHYHAFGFLLLTLLIIAQTLGSAITWLESPARWLAIACGFYLAAYLYVAMRKVYGQGRTATALKYLLLVIAYFACLGLSLTGTILYTAFTL